jgi:shikimate dehydrogenase
VHGYWLKKHGLDGEYGRVPVTPETADAFYKDFAASGLIGANVTVPHKEVAAAACAHLDDAAKAMGAANTLWLDETGALCGANTDGLGFLGNLDQLASGWDGIWRNGCRSGRRRRGAGHHMGSALPWIHSGAYRQSNL